MKEFIQTVEDKRLQKRLWDFPRGRGAFRRFKDVLCWLPPSSMLVFGRRRRSRGPAIVMGEAIQHREGDNPPWPAPTFYFSWFLGNLLPQPVMGSSPVEVRHVFAYHAIQLPLTKNR